MRCAECGYYECNLKAPFGGCAYGQRDPDKAADSKKELEEYMKKMRNVSSWFGDKAELLSAAKDLVDAVERYINPQKGQFCHRSELLIVKDKLKELLK